MRILKEIPYIIKNVNMIYGISYDKLFNELEERGFTQYSLVNLKRDTSDYEQYYGKDVIHFSNSVFETMRNNGYISLETLIKFMNLLDKRSFDDLITPIFDDDDPTNATEHTKRQQ